MSPLATLISTHFHHTRTPIIEQKICGEKYNNKVFTILIEALYIHGSNILKQGFKIVKLGKATIASNSLILTKYLHGV